jgi:phosphonate transport system substrate-binding protein
LQIRTFQIAYWSWEDDYMKLINTLLSGATMAVAMSLAGPVAAQDCPRGDLDKRFCDVNGDLIADTPTDPADLVDPDTLIFAYTPVEDPAVLQGSLV